jgi:hypothetical protein
MRLVAARTNWKAMGRGDQKAAIQLRSHSGVSKNEPSGDAATSALHSGS